MDVVCLRNDGDVGNDRQQGERKHTFAFAPAHIRLLSVQLQVCLGTDAASLIGNVAYTGWGGERRNFFARALHTLRFNLHLFTYSRSDSFAVTGSYSLLLHSQARDHSLWKSVPSQRRTFLSPCPISILGGVIFVSILTIEAVLLAEYHDPTRPELLPMM